jgi:hypothetical protein
MPCVDLFAGRVFYEDACTPYRILTTQEVAMITSKFRLNLYRGEQSTRVAVFNMLLLNNGVVLDENVSLVCATNNQFTGNDNPFSRDYATRFVAETIQTGGVASIDFTFEKDIVFNSLVINATSEYPDSLGTIQLLTSIDGINFDFYGSVVTPGKGIYEINLSDMSINELTQQQLFNFYPQTSEETMSTEQPATNTNPATDQTPTPPQDIPPPDTTSQPPAPNPNAEADKLKYQALAFKLKNGEYISESDSLFIMLGNDSALTEKVVNAISSGGGYSELKTLGLTDGLAIRALATHNQKLNVDEYESEKALDIISSNLNHLNGFASYLTQNNLQLPKMDAYIAKIRASPVLYAAARNWSKTLPAS